MFGTNKVYMAERVVAGRISEEMKVTADELLSSAGQETLLVNDGTFLIGGKRAKIRGDGSFRIDGQFFRIKRNGKDWEGYLGTRSSFELFESKTFMGVVEDIVNSVK